MDEQEIVRLKKKVNMQVERLLELEDEKRLLKNECETLKNERLELIDKLETVSKKISELENSAWAEAQTEHSYDEIIKFYTLFFKVVEKIHKNNEFIPYKNTTKYSASFYKVERRVFEGYINDCVEDGQAFIERCCQLLCIKSELDGRCVYNNDKIRVYFLNRQLVNVVLANEEDRAVGPEKANAV